MKTTKNKKTKGAIRLSPARLAEMIEEATVDAYDETEQATGWFTVLGDHLELPFDTIVLGTPVRVARIELRDDNSIVAICARGRDKQAIRLTDLPLPEPPPRGVEWIEAYSRWVGER